MPDYCGQSIFLITAEVQVEQQEASQESCNIHLLASEGKKPVRFFFAENFLLSRNHHRFWQSHMPFGRICEGSRTARPSFAREEN